MNVAGVHITVIVTLALLVLLILILSRRLFAIENIIAVTVIVWVMMFNSGNILHKFNIVSYNAYNLVAVNKLPDGGRELFINRSHSSALDANEQPIYSYIRYIEKIFIDPIQKKNTALQKPRNILILRAEGFTLGLHDHFNHYTFVDIAPKIYSITEHYFLHAPLTPNKEFVAESARAFVHYVRKKYDLIFIDTYSRLTSVPMETTTREFLLEIQHRLNRGGAVVVNQIMSPDFRDRFSVRYNNVFASVFPVYTRQVIGHYNPWATGEEASKLANVLYIYYNRPDILDRTVYTDDKNTYSLDWAR